MVDPSLQERAEEYAEVCGITLDLETPLGFGQDGQVWKSNRHTAVKAFARDSNYRNELCCYQRFSEKGITKINGFSVPRLVGFNDVLQIVEVTIVAPPFILDFGKVWIDRPPDYPAEYLSEQICELFDDRAPAVRKIIAALQVHGIYYVDPKPGNIMFEDWPHEP